MSYSMCPECGTYCIYAEFISYAKKAMIYDYLSDNNKQNYDITKMMLSNRDMPLLGKLLDELQITNICCRTHIICAYVPDDYK